MFLCVYFAGVIAGVAQDCPLAEPVASQRLRSGGLAIGAGASDGRSPVAVAVQLIIRTATE